MMAELAARRTGYCGGKGGSLHMTDFDLGILGANGIVAGGIPVAVGAAVAFQMRREERVALAFFGDGAVNEGAFHEAANLAGLWRLPVIFFCENNRKTARSLCVACQTTLPRASSTPIYWRRRSAS